MDSHCCPVSLLSLHCFLHSCPLLFIFYRCFHTIVVDESSFCSGALLVALWRPLVICIRLVLSRLFDIIEQRRSDVCMLPTGL